MRTEQLKTRNQNLKYLIGVVAGYTGLFTLSFKDIFVLIRHLWIKNTLCYLPFLWVVYVPGLSISEKNFCYTVIAGLPGFIHRFFHPYPFSFFGCLEKQDE